MIYQQGSLAGLFYNCSPSQSGNHSLFKLGDIFLCRLDFVVLGLIIEETIFKSLFKNNLDHHQLSNTLTTTRFQDCLLLCKTESLSNRDLSNRIHCRRQHLESAQKKDKLSIHAALSRPFNTRLQQII